MFSALYPETIGVVIVLFALFAFLLLGEYDE